MYVGSWVKIIDNTGGTFGKCIRVYKNTNVGSFIMVTLKKVKAHKKVKKSQLYKSLIVRTNCKFFFLGGHYGRCDSNAIILLKKNNDILGTRILSPVSHDLKKTGFVKILSIARYVY